MATYKVIQDVEAEDKLVGPLTLRQFVYAAIAALFAYLSFFAVAKNAAYMLFLFVPPALLTGFLAVPWHGDQPTEVWALAKLRFFMKPRRRIWDQSGIKDLVTITVPKRIEKHLTKDFSQTEVRSRLQALANTIDSRGWAVKNVNINMAAMPVAATDSDRLIDESILPLEVSGVNIHAADDMLDTSANPVAQHFDNMINSAASTQRQRLEQQMHTPAPVAQEPAQSPQWFMGQPAQASQIAQPLQSPQVVAASALPEPTAVAATPAATPTADEEALVARFKAENQHKTIANDHLKRVKTPAELAAEQQAAAAATAQKSEKAQVTSEERVAIMNLAQNDDLDVATIARQANKATKHDDGEVVIPLR